MIRKSLIALSILAFLVVGSRAADNALEIYFIDTEGGQSTLLVAPSGETMMIDTGFAGLDTNNPDKEPGRDAARIAEVAKAANVKQLDVLLATHFHGDHAGGVTRLTEVLPVKTFLDHGPAVQDVPTMKQKVGEYSEYWAAAFAKGQHKVVTPGDKIAVKGLNITVVQALGKSIDRPGDANQYCQGIEKKMDGNPEDTSSVGVVVQYGRFQFANLGDLPWNQEMQLLCPANRVGTVDVYQAARHGGEPSPAVFAIAPRVVFYDNGARKGGGPAALQAFRKSPGFEDVYQLHKNVPGGVEGNPADEFSANLEDTDQTSHPAHYLKLSAKDDGSFSVYNSRTNTTKAYAARRATGGK
jgi:beta-lactamase superfamily II metal-dependent hydrolase